MKKRGDFLDYQKTLVRLAVRANNAQVGMDYTEIERIRPIVRKIKNAKIGTCVFLDQSEFEVVCEKIKKPFLTVYNEAFDAFVQSVLSSEKVQLVEEVPSIVG